MPNSLTATESHVNASCCTLGLFWANTASRTQLETWPKVVASAMAVIVSATVLPFLGSPNFSEMSFTQQLTVVVENWLFSAKYFTISSLTFNTWKLVSFNPGFFISVFTRACEGIDLLSIDWILVMISSAEANLMINVNYCIEMK